MCWLGGRNTLRPSLPNLTPSEQAAYAGWLLFDKTPDAGQRRCSRPQLANGAPSDRQERRREQKLERIADQEGREAGEDGGAQGGLRAGGRNVLGTGPA